MAFNRKNSIIGPRITEKGSVLSESNAYAFEVSKDATKASIAHDIKTLYKVTPVKIAIVNTPVKRVFARGKVGKKQTPKKAYVYLKKGDTITIA
jgi:large subunit ribosomal protein L23